MIIEFVNALLKNMYPYAWHAVVMHLETVVAFR